MFRTSLHRATMEGHRDIVNVLLAEGVPIDVRSCGGVTTLHYAIEKGHEDVVNLLVVKVTLSGTGKHPYFQVTL